VRTAARIRRGRDEPGRRRPARHRGLPGIAGRRGGYGMARVRPPPLPRVERRNRGPGSRAARRQAEPPPPPRRGGGEPPPTSTARQSHEPASSPRSRGRRPARVGAELVGSRPARCKGEIHVARGASRNRGPRRQTFDFGPERDPTPPQGSLKQRPNGKDGSTWSSSPGPKGPQGSARVLMDNARYPPANGSALVEQARSRTTGRVPVEKVQCRRATDSVPVARPVPPHDGQHPGGTGPGRAERPRFSWWSMAVAPAGASHAPSGGVRKATPLTVPGGGPRRSRS
jgi:hypothetical protein